MKTGAGWRGLGLALAFSLAVVRPGQADDAKVARGLATFVHGTRTVAPAQELSLVLVGYGFTSLTAAAPLTAAAFELAWAPDNIDPASLPKALTAVKIAADASGAAHARIRAPERGAGPWTLLVRTSAFGKTRTDEIEFSRTDALSVRVVPSAGHVRAGSSVHAWVDVSRGGVPVANEPVEIALLEASAKVRAVSVRTDRDGRADAELAVPRGDAPLAGWRISATTADGSSDGVGVGVKDDTPSSSTIEWEDAPSSVLAGSEIVRRGRLIDGVGQPIANQELLWWAGPAGSESPKNEQDAWKKIAQKLRTDGLGNFELRSKAPALVGRGGLTWRLLALAEMGAERIKAKADVNIGRGGLSLELLTEGGSLLPGYENTLVLTADDRDRPIQNAGFRLEADGLATNVTTNAAGEAVVRWRVPRSVGAKRDVEPCSGSVAANVALIADATAQRAGFAPRTDVCLLIDRDQPAHVRLEPAIAVSGDSVKLTLESIGKVPKLASVVLTSDRGAVHRTTVAKDGAATLSLEGLAAGVYTASVLDVAPSSGKTSREPALGRVLVVPQRQPAPQVTLRSTDHRPNGRAEIEVRLLDDKGAPFAGTVGAIVTDKRYDEQRAARSSDVRHAYCTRASDPTEATRERGALRCGQSIQERSSFAPAYLASVPRAIVGALRDPLHDKDELARSTFRTVVKSLEGAVYEASASRDSISDVLRIDNGRRRFNPELLTLAVQALPTPPVTPGDEPIALADLMAIDAQVDFDHVARRVARYKLFELLRALRSQRGSRDSDDFSYEEPNAWLRRLVRDGTIEESQLLDPWGGMMAFVRATGKTPAFLQLKRGFALHAPGPDGRLGTADDVANPFERVLRSKSPYAEATDEDAVVDVQYQLEIADSTIDAWGTTLHAATGTELGGLGLSGTGSGGGYGGGRGSLRGGSTQKGVTLRSASASGYRALIAPRAVGADGSVRLTVPLGADETTYRVLLLAEVPGLGRLIETIDIPVYLARSVRAEPGSMWTLGDQGDLGVIVENRGGAAATLTVSAQTVGVTLVGSSERTVTVPARGRVRVPMVAKATQVGAARLTLRLREAGKEIDRLEVPWEIAAAGEAVTIARTTWVRKEAKLTRATEPGHHDAGTSTLELSSGAHEWWRRALSSADPSSLRDRRQAEDSYLMALAVERAALAAERTQLVKLAHDHAERAIGRGELLPRPDTKPGSGGCPSVAIARLWRAEPHERGDKSPNPFANEILDASCLDTQIAEAVQDLLARGSTVAIARAIVDLAEREGRQPLAYSLGLELRGKARMTGSGVVTHEVLSRAERSLVMAALLRSAPAEPRIAPETILPWLLVEQDAHGSFGSVEATSAAVRAMVASESSIAAGTSVVEIEQDGTIKKVQIAHDSLAAERVPMRGEHARVRVISGPPVVARVATPSVRTFRAAKIASASATDVQIDWPAEDVAKPLITVRVGARTSDAVSELRVPLPPNLVLARQPGGGARLIDGVLRIPVPRTGMILQLPVRSSRAGKFTAREAVLYEGGERSVTVPARTVITR